jgi:hypothetical protein
LVIIPCEGCNEEISDKAKICPQCGVKLSKKNGYVFLYRLVMYAVILFFLILQESSQGGEKETGHAEPVGFPVTYIYEGLKIEKDSYLSFELDLTHDTKVTINYQIKSGPNADVYFLSEDDYYIWYRITKNTVEEPFQYNKSLSTFNTSVSNRTDTVPKGTYYVVLDNTDYGQTDSPRNLENDMVMMDLKISAR